MDIGSKRLIRLLLCFKITNFIIVSAYPSKLIEEAVNQLSRLPGIGRKTALRLALHLLREKPEDVEALGNSLIRLRSGILYCETCHNISDTVICSICSDKKRDTGQICVVQDSRDVIAIENTQQYRGLYHVLGGVISPVEGIGPSDLNIADLAVRIKGGGIREVIMAMPATIEGDTTNFYIFRQLKAFDLSVTTIARGVSVGNDLEFTDEITLGRSILYRIPYEETRS